MKNFILIIICIAIYGCSTLNYKDPESGPRAKVRFVTKSRAPTILRRYNDKDCQTGESEMMSLSKGYSTDSYPKRLDIPLWEFYNNQAVEVYIKSDETFHGMFFGSGISKSGSNQIVIDSCAKAFSFNFREGGMYEVVYSRPRARCLVRIYSIAKEQVGSKFIRIKKSLIQKEIEPCRKLGRRFRLF